MARDSYTSEKLRLQKEMERLQNKMKRLDQKGRSPKITEIVKTMREFDITVEDLAAAFDKRTAGRKPVKAAKVGKTTSRKSKNVGEVRYIHPSGATWTGRGRAPNWVTKVEAAGQSRDQFLVKKKPDAHAQASATGTAVSAQSEAFSPSAVSESEVSSTVQNQQAPQD